MFLLSFLWVPEPKNLQNRVKIKSDKSKEEKIKMKRCYLCSPGGCTGRNASVTQGGAMVAANSLDILGFRHFEGKAQGYCKKYVVI